MADTTRKVVHSNKRPVEGDVKHGGRGTCPDCGKQFAVSYGTLRRHTVTEPYTEAQQAEDKGWHDRIVAQLAPRNAAFEGGANE